MSEKTEPPTNKKIRDAHKKGQYLFSREIVSGAILIAITSLFLLAWDFVLKHILTLMNVLLSHIHQPFSQAFGVILSQSIITLITLSLLIYGITITITILANIAQIGFVFSPAKLQKGLNALNFINNAKQIVSGRNLFQFFMNIVKIILMAYIAFLIIKQFIGEFFLAELCGLDCILWSAGRALAWMFAITSAIYIPLAIIDFIFQRYFYMKSLKMSKDEVKQEYKEMEGSPEIKSHRRQMHRDILNESMVASVSKASILIKNPDHYAIALLYDEDKTPLPLVIGKGQGAIARQMIKIAEDNNIPIYENIDLAQGLFQDSELGHYITSDFIAPVAEALNYIAQTTKGE